jgi:hypothetical protein
MVWYLLTVCVTGFLLCSSVGFWFGQRVSNGGERYPETLTAIFSTRTIDALNQDAQRFRVEGLKDFGTNITDAVGHVRNRHQSELKRRGTLDDMSEAIANLTGVRGLNLTGGITSLLGSLGDSVAGSLGTPALFLGIGLGYVCPLAIEHL